MKYKPKQIGLRHVDWVGLIISTELPAYAKLVAYQLSSYMNKTQDIAWPSQARLISECSMSNGTLNKNLNLLESEGWLVRQPGNSKQTTRYIISFPKELEKAIQETNALLNSPSHGVNSPPHGDRVLRHTETNIQDNIQDNIHTSSQDEHVPVLMYPSWMPNKVNMDWMTKSELSSNEISKVIDDFRDYWILSKSKRKNWDLSFRKNPIVNRVVNTATKKIPDKYDPYDNYI